MRSCVPRWTAKPFDGGLAASARPFSVRRFRVPRSGGGGGRMRAGTEHLSGLLGRGAWDSGLLAPDCDPIACMSPIGGAMRTTIDWTIPNGWFQCAQWFQSQPIMHQSNLDDWWCNAHGDPRESAQWDPHGSPWWDQTHWSPARGPGPGLGRPGTRPG